MKNAIPLGCFPTKEQPIIIPELNLRYVQESDSNDADPEFQELDISAEDAGGGVFIVLKTKRWAINSPDDLIRVLEDFKQRLRLEEEPPVETK